MIDKSLIDGGQDGGATSAAIYRGRMIDTSLVAGG
jgi:hypothetical protein